MLRLYATNEAKKTISVEVEEWLQRINQLSLKYLCGDEHFKKDNENRYKDNEDKLNLRTTRYIDSSYEVHNSMS